MNKTTATEINKKFVNLPEDLQRYVFEFKQPNIYIEDIEKEYEEKKILLKYWVNIYKKKLEEYVPEDGVFDENYYNNLIEYYKEYEELFLKNNYKDVFYKYRINPERIPIYNKYGFESQKKNKDLKKFNSLKNNDIFLQFDMEDMGFYCYKVIKRTECYIYYKRIVRQEYFRENLSNKYFLNIDDFELEDKIYKKMDSKIGVFIIKKNGFY
jgi:hypothetical protein